MKPLVDVVIPTRDRPEALVKCLEALARQTITDIHAIVVDDGSKQPVEDVLKNDLRARLPITVLRHPISRGPAAARNRAIRHGAAPYVAFVDDDVCADPHLIERHLAVVRAVGDHVISIGPLSAPPDWKPTPWNRWEALQVQAEYDRMEAREYVPTWRQFHTGNAFLARKVLLASGVFDERFTRAEDVELALRMSLRGYRFTFTPDAIGWHYAHRTLQAWLRIPRAYAEFDVLLDKMHPSLGWLKTVRREREQRHPIVRAARVAGRSSLLRAAMTTGLTTGARLLHRGPAIGVAMGLLSVTYDLEYGAAQKRAERDRTREDQDWDMGAVPTERPQLP